MFIMRKFSLLLVVSLYTILSAKAWIFTQNDILYETIDNATCKVTGASNSCVNAVIPATVTYDGTEYSVVSIADKAFSSNSSMETLEAAASIESLGSQAFFLAKKIKKVSMPGLRTIGSEAFYLSTLEEITFSPELTEIPTGCFNGLKSTNLKINLSNVLTIGDKAFMRCKIESLEVSGPIKFGKWSFQQAEIGEMKVCGKVSLPEGAMVFDSGKVGTLTLEDFYITENAQAFNPKATNLIITQTGSDPILFGTTPAKTEATSLYLNVNPADIEGDYGLSMSELKDLELGDKVKTVEPYWFNPSKKLASVKMSGNVEKIGTYAFGGSDVLTSVTCYAQTPPVCEENAFTANAYSSGKLYVPEGAESAYATATAWKNFTNIIGSLAGIGDVTSDNVYVGSVYSISGIKVKENVDESSLRSLSPGIYIFNGRKVILK